MRHFDLGQHSMMITRVAAAGDRCGAPGAADDEPDLGNIFRSPSTWRLAVVYFQF
jgi:hypothetical protein